MSDLPHDPRHDPLYTPAMAAHLLDLNDGRVRRWLGSSPSAAYPLVARGADAHKPLATFLDLVELLLVRELVVRAGFKVRALRDAIDEASARLGIDHPLARRQLYADGRHLLIRDGGEVLSLRSGGQLALRPILEARMRVLDFDELDVASRWWPEGRAGGVVIDPAFGYGAPTVPHTGIDTEVLYNLWLAEGRDAARVAWAYDLDVDAVQRAVDWHGRHLGAEAA